MGREALRGAFGKVVRPSGIGVERERVGRDVALGEIRAELGHGGTLRLRTHWVGRFGVPRTRRKD